MSKFGTSQSVLRKEDRRFLTGEGRFLDDAAPESALHAVFFRSPVAHARIARLETAAAAAAPGVLAVWHAGNLGGRLDNRMKGELVRNRDGSRGAAPRRPILAEERVRYAGEPIALVVAESRAAAMDAAEVIAADFDDLPVHVATAVGGPTIHPEAPDNLAYDWAFGDEAAVAAAFAAAAHTTRLELVDNRVMAMPMEPRGCFAEWDGAAAARGLLGAGGLGAARRAGRAARPGGRGGQGDDAGRGRRLRDEGLQLPGVFRRGLRRARARAAGALDEHPRRGDGERHRRARPCDGGGGGVRRRLPAAGAPDRLRLEPRRLQRARRAAHRLEAGAEGDARGLRRAEGALRGEGGLSPTPRRSTPIAAPGGRRRST